MDIPPAVTLKKASRSITYLFNIPQAIRENQNIIPLINIYWRSIGFNNDLVLLVAYILY